MRVLVTGAGGFAGRWLVRELADHGHTPIAFDTAFSQSVAGATESVTGDLRDGDSILKVFKNVRPDACAHLGAISFVPAGNADPSGMLSVNICGTMNVLKACVTHAPACRVLFVSTALVYGSNPHGSLLTEESRIAPSSVYAISKAAAELACIAAGAEQGIPVICARPNNHTGPGQSRQFVVAAFADQIRAIAGGQAKPVMRVGNLDSKRDVSDVRDVVAAYRLLLEKGRTNEMYNISSRNLISIRDILERLCRIANVKPEITVDPALYRATDCSPLLDTSKTKRDTGWEPAIPIETTFRDMLA